MFASSALLIMIWFAGDYTQMALGKSSDLKLARTWEWIKYLFNLAKVQYCNIKLYQQER